MADQSNVEAAIVSIIANALYPGGDAVQSSVGYACKVYRGWPKSPTLDADLAENITNISVHAAESPAKNVTRYPRIWQTIGPAEGTLSVTMEGSVAIFSGSCSTGMLAGVMVDGQTYFYAVQASDSPQTVASNIAALLREAGWIVEYSASQVAVPQAIHFSARVVSGSGVMKEIRRQEQGFMISIWCASPVVRDVVVPVVDDALAKKIFIALVDGTYGRLRFENQITTDSSEDADLYRRDLVYMVEYPTTILRSEPAMLFGTIAETINASVDKTYIS